MGRGRKGRVGMDEDEEWGEVGREEERGKERKIMERREGRGNGMRWRGEDGGQRGERRGSQDR